MNLKVRMKNPWFWVGLLGVLFTAMRISPEMLTSWDILGQELLSIVKNPIMLFGVIAAVLGVLIDPTTCGVKDSSQAMTYLKPKQK